MIIFSADILFQIFKYLRLVTSKHLMVISLEMNFVYTLFKFSDENETKLYKVNFKNLPGGR